MSQTMNVSMTPFTQTSTLLCSQYDVGRVITVNLVDNSGDYTIPPGATVKIEATKPSGYGFSETCTWTGSTVTITLTETMTQEGGRFPAELVVTSGDTVLGSANFLMRVEGSPHLEDVIDGDAETAQALTLRVTALETQVATNTSAIGTLSNLDTTEQGSLVGAVNELKSDIEELQQGGGGLTADIKTALLNCFDHVTWDDDDPTGETYINALEQALYPPADLVSISAVYTQGGTVYDNQTLDSLRSDLVVTAHMGDSTTQTVTTYTLSGTLATGTSTITVAYGGKTTTFTVTVTHATTQYTITNTLTHCTNSNSATVVNEEASYSGTLTADTDYIMSTVAITMGGTDVTSTAYNSSTGAISIASVTGNVVITAEAVEDVGWVSGVPYDMTDGLTENKYLNNGTETAYNGWSISPYLSCNGAFIISDTAFTLSYCAGYDSENSYVQRVRVNQGIPTNYDALGCTSFRVSDTSSKVAGAVITPYRLPELSETTAYETSQYYASSEWTEGGYVNTNTGAITTNSGYKYSDYMNCYNATTITDNITAQAREYCFYDGNKDFISGVEIGLSDTTQNKQTSIPSGARYFRASTATGQYNLCFKLS